MSELSDTASPAPSRTTTGGVVGGPSVLALETYRHLRMMLVTLPALIVVAILALAARGTLQGSISDYYGQPVRDVFVGAMVGTAVCLIAYRGFPPFEDYVLNLAGFFAVFVAFVPNTFADDLAALEPAQREEALFGLRASLAAVVLVALVFVGLERRYGLWSLPSLLNRSVTKWLLVVTSLLPPAFLGLVLLTGFADDDFRGVHMTAAVLLFVCLALAVATQGWPSRFGGEGPDNRRYQVIVWLMAAGLPLAGALAWAGSTHTVLLVEGWEIGLFAWFWVLEARRTWPRPQERGQVGSSA